VETVAKGNQRNAYRRAEIRPPNEASRAALGDGWEESIHPDVVYSQLQQSRAGEALILSGRRGQRHIRPYRSALAHSDHQQRIVRFNSPLGGHLLPIIDLFSRRNEASTQTGPDGPIYDHIPERVRVQIMYIWQSSIGRYVPPSRYHGSPRKRGNNRAWQALHDFVRREKGLLQLSKSPRNPRHDCIEYLLNEPNVDNVLDIVELSCLTILKLRNIDRHYTKQAGITQSADDAISELNTRFKQANLGYQFESGQIIKTDNFAMHETVVKPTLLLLTDRNFSGVNNEFLAALKHHRAGNHRDAITAANSALESTLKTICKIRHWQYHETDTLGRLLKIVRREGLFPDYMGKPFEQLIATLQSGLTPIRNRESSSHGQGTEVKSPPEHVTEYALNLCATQIMLLIKSMHAIMK